MVIEPIDPDGKTLARGSLVRGWASVLKQQKITDAVARRLTPEVEGLLREPPGPTEWVDVAYFECIAQAVQDEVGEERLDALFIEAQSSGWVPLLTRFAGGIARVYGPSPETVLKHAPAAAKANTVGFALSWEDLGADSGQLIAEYPFRPRIHPAAAWGTSAACELAARVVGVPVERDKPFIESMRGGGTRVRARLSW